MLYSLAVFLPLIGACIAGLFGRLIGDRASQYATCGALIASAAISLLIFYEVALGGEPRSVVLFTWMTSGTFDVGLGAALRQLTAVMVFVVTVVVSACVHVYSIGYMAPRPVDPALHGLSQPVHLLHADAGDGGQSGPALLRLGRASGSAPTFLIGFWYDRPAANAAAIKAFIVNRVGDFGFALGIFGVSFRLRLDRARPDLRRRAGEGGRRFNFLGFEFPGADVHLLLLFIGAMGKSAQLGLHTWLPDAMEGPTPVSALIHAATMVTAGVFMVARMSPLVRARAGRSDRRHHHRRVDGVLRRHHRPARTTSSG